MTHSKPLVFLCRIRKIRIVSFLHSFCIEHDWICVLHWKNCPSNENWFKLFFVDHKNFSSLRKNNKELKAKQKMIEQSFRINFQRNRVNNISFTANRNWFDESMAFITWNGKTFQMPLRIDEHGSSTAFVTDVYVSKRQ